MTRLRSWLQSLITAAVLDAMRRRDLQLDEALERLKGQGGQAAADRYTQLKDGRLY